MTKHPALTRPNKLNVCHGEFLTYLSRRLVEILLDGFDVDGLGLLSLDKKTKAFFEKMKMAEGESKKHIIDEKVLYFILCCMSSYISEMADKQVP